MSEARATDWFQRFGDHQGKPLLKPHWLLSTIDITRPGAQTTCTRPVVYDLINAACIRDHSDYYLPRSDLLPCLGAR